jgi:tryptophanyl-tRNA synthetase
VPVGKDQMQHLEVARDIAVKFNAAYGDVFTLPEPYIQEQVAIVPGTDGGKMSKSHGNTLDVFGDEKSLKKKIMSIVMDSRSLATPKPDADQNIAIQLLKLVAPADIAQEAENELREGYLGYGDLKNMLFEHYQDYFAKPRELYNDLKKNQDYVEAILEDGAARAACTTTFTMKNVRKAVGL